MDQRMFAAVHEFITAFDAKPDWAKLIDEEAKEVIEAVENLIKEVADLSYVLTGGALAGMGDGDMEGNANLGTALKWLDRMASLFPDNLLHEAFDLVHASNMSKLDDDGKPIRREDGKIMKGPNYRPPVLSDLVRRV